ncbi:MAG TPA: TlpA disulfide reductase family protein [Gaiellaceae bacterium]|nr:TlpA disulfide reductase family protein [Gaiellaceae bacterium]
MPSLRVLLVALAALLAGVSAVAAAVMLVGDDGGRPPSSSTGESEPLSGPEVRLSGTDVSTGAVIGLGKLEDKPVVVTVWGSWCPACPKQAEPLRRFAAAHEGTAVLAVDTQEDAEAAKAFLEASGLSLPTIADEDGHIAAKLGVRELPTTIFLTPEHRVASMWEGQAGLDRLKEGLAAARAG